MDLLAFIIKVVIISVSGALAPGPLFFVTISYGAKLGAKSGLAFSVAHTLIEFPLVILLALGLLTVANEPTIKLLTGVAGGLALLVLGVLQIRDGLTSKLDAPNESRVTSKNPLLVGLVLTGLNPFFIGWWLTIGADLILQALAFASLAGVMLMYVSHIWMDYVWLTAVAHFAKMGINVVGVRVYKAVVIVFGALLIFFGLLFLTSIL
jgi:threonine/homoserine/homoserine lactone efflux protein